MPSRIAMADQGEAYFVSSSLAGHHPGLQTAFDRERFLTVLEQVRAAFQARLFAYRVQPHRVLLTVALRDYQDEPDGVLRERWRQLTARTLPPCSRLRQRLSTLSGFMQTVLQRFSRDWNRRHHQHGKVWGGRFRTTLLADDCALLAAVSWLEDTAHPLEEEHSSRGRHDQRRPLVALAAPPLRIGPGDFICPADEAPPGCYPPPGGDLQPSLARFADTIHADARQAYGHALCNGWALGRPESLGGVLARLGRHGGRGRGRCLRDLDDQLGLCGVWG